MYPAKVLQAPSEIENIRDLWTRWQYHPNSDIDFFLTIANARKDNVKPYVLVIGSEDEPVALAVGRIEDSFLPVKVGYKVLFRVSLKTIVVVHCGLLGEQSDTVSRLILSALQQALKSGQAEVVRFEAINIDAEVVKLLHEEIPPLLRENFIETQTHWKMTIPNKVDEVLSCLSKKRRNQFRRMVKKLETDFSAGFKIHCFQAITELDQMFIDVEEIAKKTYQRGLGVGFIDNAENRNRLMLEAAKGWLRMYVLYLNGKPSAYWWGVVYGETFHSCALGYDPEFHNYSPGSYLLTKGLESLCQQGVKELDFGLGDARYKQQFGDNNYKEATISLFAQTLQGISLNCILSLNNVMTLIAKRILKRFKIIETLKKHWRSKLRPVDDEA